MRKSTKTILIILAIVAVIAALVGSYMLHNKETGGEVTTTAEPTETLVPTKEPEVTMVPTEIVEEPTKEPEETVAPTATATPTVTEIPVVTEEPTATMTPMPSATPTSTPTPEPTATPTPVVTGNLLLRVQMGDDVWYEYYEGGVLLVTGTGSTWDFDTDEHGDKGCENEMTRATKTIIISEGITRIGHFALGVYDYVSQISIPTTLKEVGKCGLRSIGEDATTTEWIGLDLSKIDAHEKAFLWANGLDNMDTTNLIIQPTSTPTPTPTCTPTPTPTPNPDEPRLCHSFKMGADATYEFWDNGYLYIKGTGKVDDKSELFDWEYKYGVPDKFIGTIKYIQVEEGITSIGKYTHVTSDEVWLPSTVTHVGICSVFTKTLHCYQDGKPVKVTSTKTKDVYELFRALSDPVVAEQWEVSITEE